MKLNIESQSNNQDYNTRDEFIGDNGHGCLSYKKVYVGMKTRCTLGTDVHLCGKSFNIALLKLNCPYN